MLPASRREAADRRQTCQAARKSRRNDRIWLPARIFRQHFGAISEKSPDGRGNVRANGDALIGLQVRAMIVNHQLNSGSILTLPRRRLTLQTVSA
jgi:hypothetical protein